MTRFLTLFLLLASAAPALADQQNYPFKLVYRQEAGKITALALNNGPAPMLVTVDLGKSVNVESDHASPILVVVKPSETVPVATVHAADKSKAFRLAVSYKFSIGDPDAVPDPAALYRLPFRDGQKIMIGQIRGGRITTHTGPDSEYAIDFDVPIGTPILAARKGVVVDIDQDYTEGGNDSRFKANHVLILQEDGTLAVYSHLAHNGAAVTMGQVVEAGTLIGTSGNTGYSSGPHLHFAVLTNTRTPDGTAKYLSRPVKFVNGSPAREIELAQDQVLVVNRSGKPAASVRAGSVEPAPIN
jgi:murein DD-endopeptidase MepM/ murein hydrolase activator NlpD